MPTCDKGPKIDLFSNTSIIINAPTRGPDPSVVPSARNRARVCKIETQLKREASQKQVVGGHESFHGMSCTF